MRHSSETQQTKTQAGLLLSYALNSKTICTGYCNHNMHHTTPHKSVEVVDKAQEHNAQPQDCVQLRSALDTVTCGICKPHIDVGNRCADTACKQRHLDLAAVRHPTSPTSSIAQEATQPPLQHRPTALGNTKPIPMRRPAPRQSSSCIHPNYNPHSSPRSPPSWW
jgi:hypothetical protein